MGSVQGIGRATPSQTFEKDAKWFEENVPEDTASEQASDLGIDKDNLFKLYESWSKNNPLALAGGVKSGTFAPGVAPNDPAASAYNWIQNQVQTQQAQKILQPPADTSQKSPQPDFSYLSSLGGGTPAAAPTAPSTPATSTAKIPLGYNPYTSPLNQIGALSDLGVQPSAIAPLSSNFGLGQQMVSPGANLANLTGQKASSFLSG